jgi:two-component system OmpR family response regulator
MTAAIGMDGQPPMVLVADGDEEIRSLSQTALRFAGFQTVHAATGEAALRLLTQLTPSLAILDATLPDLDGFEVARRLRQPSGRLPVLFLSARGATADRVAGLRLGADDYLTKPFTMTELIARVQSVLRRTRSEADSVLIYADLYLDEAAHHVRRAGRLVNLSPTEYRLLRYLMLNAGRVVSKAQILDVVWQYDFGGDSSIVEKFISTLRRKIDIEQPRLLQTVRGFGYVLRTPTP